MSFYWMWISYRCFVGSITLRLVKKPRNLKWRLYLNDNDEFIIIVNFKKLEDPILIIRWLVGSCVWSFSEPILTWKEIFIVIRNLAPSSSTHSNITSSTINLINSARIINNCYLIAVFTKHVCSLALYYFCNNEMGI